MSYEEEVTSKIFDTKGKYPVDFLSFRGDNVFVYFDEDKGLLFYIFESNDDLSYYTNTSDFLDYDDELEHEERRSANPYYLGEDIISTINVTQGCYDGRSAF